MGLRLIAILGSCLRSSFDAATGRFFSKSLASAMKRSAVNSGFLPPKEEKPTLMVGSLGRSLCLRIHRQHRVVLYASEPAFIDFAVDNEKGWRELEVPPMTMLTIRHEDVRAIENSEFRFIPQERKGTLPEGVNA